MSIANSHKVAMVFVPLRSEETEVDIISTELVLIQSIQQCLPTLWSDIGMDGREEQLVPKLCHFLSLESQE